MTTAFVTDTCTIVLVGALSISDCSPQLYLLDAHLTGRKRFSKLGETACVVFIDITAQFLLMHWVGLLGQRRAHLHYDLAGSGWEVNQTASPRSSALDGDRALR